VLPHVVCHVDVDGVHARHGVASAVHLEHLLHVGVLQDRRVRVPVVVRLDVAGEVGPGSVGQVRGLVLPVPLANRDARPGLGLYVDGSAGASADGVESLGGRSEDVVGVVRPVRVAEARFGREWNTSVYEQAHSPEEAAAIAARVSPDLERVAAMLARAEARTALSGQPPTAGHGELVQIHADAGRFYQSCLPGSWVPGYLAGRGLEAVLLPASPWKIGYAPRSWTALTSHLRELGFSDEAMLRSGLAVPGKDGKPRDMFRDRLMIPIRRPGDRVVIAFVGRRHPDAGDEQGPKYLNSPNTELYVKCHVLPGLAEGQRFLDQGAQPVIVEGVTDAWPSASPHPAATSASPCAERHSAASKSRHSPALSTCPSAASGSRWTPMVQAARLPSGHTPASRQSAAAT
jgi:DNA primase catalytic core, N-terminal domain